jgi:hypothetical protein
MSVDTADFSRDEPPATPAQQIVRKAAQLLLYVLCFGPIALFPLGLAYKLYLHFMP